MKLPHPRLVQPPSPRMRAEIGQQTVKAERFGQELRQELRADHSNHERAEAMVITLSIVGGVVGSSRDDSLGVHFLLVGGNFQAKPVSDLSRDILVVLSPCLCGRKSGLYGADKLNEPTWHRRTNPVPEWRKTQHL